jgi:tetratricopeptide (TPR) repeat protein
MTETNNSNRPIDSPDDALAKALDTLMDGRQTRSGTAFTDAAEVLRSDTQHICPEPSAWTGLACGDTRPAELDKLLADAAGCGECAAKLHQSLSLFSAEVTPQEAAEAANLTSATREWQHQLAVELAHTPIKNKNRMLSGLFLWTGAGLTATLILSVSLTFWWQSRHTPEQLLAEAYSKSRHFDLRMPGAGFVAVRPESYLRGSDAADELPQLKDARTRIEHHLASTPNDPHWLQLEARADVLQEKYDPAIDILDHLLVAGPVTSSLLLDDAAAYYQRGTCSGDDNDRTKALDDLRRADELAPGDPVVLFNEAVVMEDCGQVMNAVETWNRYLRFENNPQWQAEGRRRLQALELKLDKIKTHQSS